MFHPDLRKDLPAVNHEDGTVKCNTFHHRGFCYTKCKFKASHSKTLSENKLVKMRKYRSSLIEKWKQKNGENNWSNITYNNHIGHTMARNKAITLGMQPLHMSREQKKSKHIIFNFQQKESFFNQKSEHISQQFNIQMNKSLMLKNK